MKKATDEVVSELKARGYRITEARKKVIEQLALHKQPVSIQGLCGRIQGIDEASIYRTVSTLLSEGFLEEILLPGEASRYALSHGHHHHAVCTSCGIMEHIECSLSSLPVPSSFSSVDTHEVTLFGLCKKCA